MWFLSCFVGAHLQQIVKAPPFSLATLDPQSLNARAAPPFGDSSDLEMADNLQYLPWTWTVKPSDLSTHCPPASSILGTFAVVNVLVSIIGLIFGNRLVVNFVSCGVFGRPGRPGSTGWAYLCHPRRLCGKLVWQTFIEEFRSQSCRNC